jgi:hypothetical protein
VCRRACREETIARESGGAHPGASTLSGPALTHGFEIAFYALAAVAAAGAVLALLMIESQPPVVAQEIAVEEEVALKAA